MIFFRSENKDGRKAMWGGLVNQGLLMLALLFVSVLALVIFGAYGWFAAGKKVNATGMQVAVDGQDYEILVLEGGSNGVYYDNYHESVKDPSAMVWQMTDENNMDNNELYNEIYPGSHGVVSFYVRPRVESVELDFSFEILGYTAEEDSETHAITMTRLAPDVSPALFLNGHILLFEEREGTEDDYTYSKPILSNEDMKRVISQKTFTGSGTSTLVDIYWVWPQTLSDLVDARDCEKVAVTKVPFTASGDSYNAVVNNILIYPDFYCKYVSRSADENERLNESDIVTDYDKYGDYYDQADNDIGMGVHFILLKLSVTKSSGE